MLRSTCAALFVLFVLAGSVFAGTPAPTTADVPDDPQAFLAQLEERTFRWFADTQHPKTGLFPDRHPTKSFSSVAACGFGLTALPIGAERGWMPRSEAAARALRLLETLYGGPQGKGPYGMTGYKGFFYHFVAMDTGHRFDTGIELSTIDTALLVAGALAAKAYFDGPNPVETRLRELADALYARVDWAWAQHDAPLLSHGWNPENGFLPYDWGGYNEAMILYVLALGSPTHPIEPPAWEAWAKTYKWGTWFGLEYVGFEPLFGHQFTHAWIDLRGLADAPMRAHGIDYFENSRRATYAQRAYATVNPGKFLGYDETTWGLSASDGPGPMAAKVSTGRRAFEGYWARGASHDGVRDDGTIAPYAAGSSIVFAPEIVVPALHGMARRYGADLYGAHGFVDAFNPTFDRGSARSGKVVKGKGWFGKDRLGIDQGPLLLMLANHRDGLVWRLMKKNPEIERGLRRAGFTGGWLDPAR